LTDQWSLSTIRHGETDFNRESRYAGTIDVALNDDGRDDARLASVHIRSIQFDVSIASPFKRSIETAQILTEGSIDVIPCEYAQERNFGILQGLTSVELERIRPPIHFIKMGGDYHSIDVPGAETFEELRARAEKFLQHVFLNFKGRRVLVVSHSVFLQQLHGLLRGQDWMEALRAHVGNLELTTFHFENEKVVSEDCLHLMIREENDF